MAASLELGPQLFGRHNGGGSIFTSFKSIAANPNRTQPSPIRIATDPSQVSSSALTQETVSGTESATKNAHAHPRFRTPVAVIETEVIPAAATAAPPSPTTSAQTSGSVPPSSPRPPPPPGSHPPLLRSASSDPAHPTHHHQALATPNPIHLGRLKHPIASCGRRSDEEILPRRL